jgi:hypothetical protein
MFDAGIHIQRWLAWGKCKFCSTDNSCLSASLASKEGKKAPGVGKTLKTKAGNSRLLIFEKKINTQIKILKFFFKKKKKKKN